MRAVTSAGAVAVAVAVAIVSHYVAMLQQAPKLLDDGTAPFSRSCLDGRDGASAACRGLLGGIDNPAQIPVRASDWPARLGPILSLKQRRPVKPPRLHSLHPLVVSYQHHP